jgi:hypothetical protein
MAEHKAISSFIQDATFRCMAKLVEMTAVIGQYASPSVPITLE